MNETTLNNLRNRPWIMPFQLHLEVLPLFGLLLPEIRLYFRPHFFYWIKTRAIRRQIKISDSECVQYLSYNFCVMGTHIIHHDNAIFGQSRY